MERSLDTPEVPEYGLIGYPLSHSFSPAYFKAKFEREEIRAKYSSFELKDIGELPDLIRTHPGLAGLNVTTPHKQAVIPYLDSVSDDARAIGAVNCIRIQAGKLYGYNTDWMGFRDSLEPLLGSGHTAALILGSGGASLAIQYALQQMHISFLQVSRSGLPHSLRYEELTEDLIARHSLIINTTTLGTLGEGLPPIPYEALSTGHLLYDLVYNPAVTPFLTKGIERGARTKNGLVMLHLQAEASWQVWQGARA